MPISYDTLVYRIYQRNTKAENLSTVLLVARGGTDSKPPVMDLLNEKKNKKINPAFHRRLEQHFPDWDGRIEHQRKQEQLYESAMKRERESKKLGIGQSFKVTEEELDAIAYFQGTGFYRKHQDPETKPNILDTRQTFLLKMHKDELRDRFESNRINRTNNRKD